MVFTILHYNVHILYFREEIFAIHTREMRESGTLSPDINLKELAANTTRFSGAEIAGVVRGAASYALERKVSQQYCCNRCIQALCTINVFIKYVLFQA